MNQNEAKDGEAKQGIATRQSIMNEAKDADDDEAEDGEEECPICFEFRATIEPLPHVGGGAAGLSKSNRDVSSHRACEECRAQLVAKNQRCPWCRDEVVWNDVFGFLDGLKGDIGKANDPDSLADLMAKWEEYELTRSNSDVIAFARDMVTDDRLCAHLDRARSPRCVGIGAALGRLRDVPDRKPRAGSRLAADVFRGNHRGRDIDLGGRLPQLLRIRRHPGRRSSAHGDSQRPDP